jgi:hypothetical protein
MDRGGRDASSVENPCSDYSDRDQEECVDTEENPREYECSPVECVEEEDVSQDFRDRLSNQISIGNTKGA